MKYIEIELGRGFGNLIVLSKGPKKDGHWTWICRCSCGDIRGYKGTLLNKGKRRSCGCGSDHIKGLNKLGLKSGFLTVIAKTDFKLNELDHNQWWICRCDLCGNNKTLRASDLRKRKSCGCDQGDRVRERCAAIREKTGHRGEGFGYMTGLYRRSAIRCNRVWNLSDDQVAAISKSACTYCGAEPAREYGHKTIWIGNGIDRVNNKIGYEPDNVVPCCSYCNYMKRSMSVEDFKNHIKRIYEHSIKPQSLK